MTIKNAEPFFAWDVSAFLALFVVSAFVIVLLDYFFVGVTQTNLQPKKNLFSRWLYFVCFLKFNKSEKYANRPKIVQLAADLYPVLLLVFLFRSFIAEPFRIPSNSMMPTFLTYDFLLVDKISYGLHLPFSNTELFNIGDPQRGDVVVFRYPNYERQKPYEGADFIKRVIGLPGDRIEYMNDALTVNGKTVEYQRIGTYVGFEKGIKMTGHRHYRELLDDRPHDILLHPYMNSRGVSLVVPEGHYFVMGDNRNHSSDSRFWGFVPEEYIVGRAFYIWAHGDTGGALFGPNRWESLKTFTFSRNGLID